RVAPLAPQGGRWYNARTVSEGPAGMNVPSAESLLGLLRSYSLVSAPQLEQLRALPAAGPGAAAALLREAVRRNFLTVFQADLIARGAIDRLAYGAYRLIDRLGRGGVGQVFRAWDLRRQVKVALKVVQHELRDNPEILGRFQREVKAVRQLNHPNIVRA